MTTEERLEALERGLSAAKRRNKYLLIGLVVFALGFGFTITTETVQAQPVENLIRAERFELVDSRGHTRASLGMEESGPVLYLFDGIISPEKARASLRVSDDFGPVLDLCDDNGMIRARLGVYEGFGPVLDLFDENGKARAILAVDETDVRPVLDLLDENGDLIWSAP